MKLRNARNYAQLNADRTGEPYTIVRRRNGQWLLAKSSFYETEYGRQVHATDLVRETFKPRESND